MPNRIDPQQDYRGYKIARCLSVAGAYHIWHNGQIIDTVEGTRQDAEKVVDDWLNAK